MKSYIHLYKKNSEFTEAYNGPDYDEPWLSLTEENMDVNYNKTPPVPPKELTAITFGTIIWVTDIPATGGTATKDNCTYTIIARYIGSRPEDITSQVDDVTGELTVEETTIEQRHEAGQLTLSASYCGFTATGNVTVYQEAVDFSMEPLTFIVSSPGAINWQSTSTSNAKTIEYKLNDGEWTSITSNTGTSAPSISVIVGDVVKFRGNNAGYNGSWLESTAGFTLEGNIMSLIDSKNYGTLTTLTSEYTFSNMFNNCTGLTSAENLILPATTLTYACYYCMFAFCESLTIAPELPATTLAPYCYDYMFQRCYSLTTAPSILPATTLTGYCYHRMFEGCRSLTQAPELPATALTQACYASMFYGCTNLNYVKCLATDISASFCTNCWLLDVSSTGTFVKNPNIESWSRGYSGIPNEWSVQDA